MRVLNLTSKENSPLIELQVDALESRGIDCTTLSVPGTIDADTSRSPMQYLRFQPTVLKHAFGSYDLVHANYGLLGPFALAQPNLPVVLSLWGSDLYGRFGWLSRQCAAFADETVVMSERMAADLGIDCRVVPHGVDLEQFEPEPRSASIERTDWEPTEHNVLFPYNPDRAVKNYPRAERVVAAVDDRLSRPVRLQPLPGAVPHDEMSTFMNAADSLLVTSKHEGSPNVVKEAMACNLPVVSADVGDVSERLAGVEPSAVGRTDEELVSALASILRRGEPSNGREHAAEISKRQMAAQLEEIYREVAGKPADRGDAGTTPSRSPRVQEP